MLRALSIFLVLAACAPSTQPTPIAPEPAPAAGNPGEAPRPGGPPPCTTGQEWFTPGAGAGAQLTSGCYTRCDAAVCPSGQVCQSVTVNPCGQTEDGQVRSCMQASQQSRLCLAG